MAFTVVSAEIENRAENVSYYVGSIICQFATDQSFVKNIWFDLM